MTVFEIAYQSSTLTTRTTGLKTKDSRAFLDDRSVVDGRIVRSNVCQVGFLLPELAWQNLKNRYGEQRPFETTADNKVLSLNALFVR